MKTYKFEVVVTEGYDEFWEELYGKSGCDEVTKAIQNELFQCFPEATVKLIEYKNDTP